MSDQGDTVHARRYTVEPTPDGSFVIIAEERLHPLGAMLRRRRVGIVHSETAAWKLADELNGQYTAGVVAGMRRFAWWTDGVEYVGTTGTTLARAIEDFLKGDEQ